jgi:hypothetical protein
LAQNAVFFLSDVFEILNLVWQLVFDAKLLNLDISMTQCLSYLLFMVNLKQHRYNYFLKSTQVLTVMLI